MGAGLRHGNRVIVVINTLKGVSSPVLQRFLARGSLSRLSAPAHVDERIFEHLQMSQRLDGRAALRYRGQNGSGPSGWIAAADPIYLEPRLDHLCLHTLSHSVSKHEMATLMAHLNSSLGDSTRFSNVGVRGYVEAQALATAALGADELHGHLPNEFLPKGQGADDFRRLQSEIEMVLHEHPINLERQARGQQPVNALWIWGGGLAAVSKFESLPILVGDDPLLRAVWAESEAESQDWSGTLAPVFAKGGVAVVPEDASADTEKTLQLIRDGFRSSSQKHLTILTRNGWTATIRRSDRWKFWRTESALSGATA